MSWTVDGVIAQVQRIETPRIPEARNPTLASVLHEIHLAETRGTGIRRMRKRMQAMGLPEPELQSDRAANRFQVGLSFHHLLDEADWSWLVKFEGVDNADRQVLWLALRPEGVRNEDVREVCGDETLNASNRLGRLRDRGYLVRRGTAKQHAWYEVAREHRPTTARAEGARPGQPVDLAAQPVDRNAQPVDLAAQPVDLAAQPVDLNAQPVDLNAQPVDLNAQPVDLNAQPVDLNAQPRALPQALQARVDALPRRPRRAELEALLLDLCRLGWWAPGHLARLVGRNRSYLLATYLSPMVDDRRLVMRHPDRKHHPRQAYAAAPSARERSE